ncbi:MAG: carboxypeptidase-like regulatory domain-containing protein [Candidatus Sericytochromatia bacterium]
MPFKHILCSSLLCSGLLLGACQSPASTPQPGSGSVKPTSEAITIHVDFTPEKETELVAYYPVRVAVENEKGEEVATKEIFSDELAKGITLSSSKLKLNDSYQVRIQGQNYNGKCLGSAHFSLKPQGPDTSAEQLRTLSAAELTFKRADFSAASANDSCQVVLTVNGQVVDSSGNGLVGVRLTATYYNTQTGKLSFRHSAVTDAQGNYQLKAFPPGVKVSLSASKGGFFSTQKILSFGYGPTDSTFERRDLLQMSNS